jgi:hypothetical protein
MRLLRPCGISRKSYVVEFESAAAGLSGFNASGGPVLENINAPQAGQSLRGGTGFRGTVVSAGQAVYARFH